MKKILVTLNLWLVFYIMLPGQSISFKTYMNPVIPGDHPDCTLTKVGNDFYTTGSSFNPTPVIYHSTDLVHWEAVAQPVSAAWTGYGDAPGGGCWGGQVVYYNNKWWDFFKSNSGMCFVTADSVKGPWSMPTVMKTPSQVPGLGYDNSIFIDNDTTWYLLVKNGQVNNWIVQLGNNGQPQGRILNLTWLNPSPSYPYSWAEGPVMWKHDGYYYYSFAKDLSGGQWVMRSDTLTADKSAWKMLGDFFNVNDPQASSSLFTTPNHASAVVTLDDSTYWVMHPLYAKGEWKGQGRQGLLNQVHYSSTDKPTADYPDNTPFIAPHLPSSGIPWMVPHSDFFHSDTLNPEWSFLGYTAADKWSLTDRPGWLRLSPKSSSKANTVIKNDGEHNYSLITKLNFSPETSSDQAGLWIMRGDETMAVKLVSSLSSSTGNKVIIFSFGSTQYEATNTIGDTLWLKLVRINHKISGYFSSDGNDWTQVGQAFDVSVIDSYSDFSTFTGTRQGLYVKGMQTAWFDLYIYRDAYTPILAECPANQLGTARFVQNADTTVLNHIYYNDWAMYAGVEFGNDDYDKNADSIKVVASSATDGGTVEVYIDSIDASTKIAECNIKSTGSWTNYKKFSAKLTSKVSGHHDVYLLFTGSTTNQLFRLHSFYFTTSNFPTGVSGKDLNGYNFPKKFELEQNYPNPFNPTTTISYSIPAAATQNLAPVQLKVYNVLGKVVTTLVNNEQRPGYYKVEFNADNLASGVYYYRIEAGSFDQTKKMVLLK